jgi:hypothetical protein
VLVDWMLVMVLPMQDRVNNKDRNEMIGIIARGK